jgi:hypothetical protein
MQIMFHDILENTSALFATTSERPTSTVVIGYLNEAQNRFFNERYLAGDVIQNITIAKSLKTELRNLLVTKTLKVLPIDTYPNAYHIEDPVYINTIPVALDTYDTWGEFEYYVEGTVKVRRSSILTCNADFIELLPISALNLNKYITNFTNVPILPQPVITVDNGLSASAGMIITDQYTRILNKAITDSSAIPSIYSTYSSTKIEIDAAELAKGTEENPRSTATTYSEAYIVILKRPTTLTLTSADTTFKTCDIDARFHEQIVRLAVEMFLGDKGKFARPQQQTKE